MKNTLEGNKLFPVIAWALVISFAFFTYTLAASLQKNLGGLDENTTTTVDVLQGQQTNAE